MTDDMTPYESGLMDQVEAAQAEYDRQEKRRRRLTFWVLLVPYACGAIGAGVGLANVINANMIGTFALLLFGYLTLIVQVWAVPGLLINKRP